MKKYLLFALFVSLSGCIIVATPEPSSVVVKEAPPQVIVEVRPTAPATDYVWIQGYWSWQGARWVWVAGHWEARRVGYIWIEPHYNYQNNNHYYVAGGWTKDKGYSGKGSNQGYSTGKGSNQGYSTGKGSKCPKGYVWSEGACRYQKK